MSFKFGLVRERLVAVLELADVVPLPMGDHVFLELRFIIERFTTGFRLAAEFFFLLREKEFLRTGLARGNFGYPRPALDPAVLVGGETVLDTDPDPDPVSLNLDF